MQRPDFALVHEFAVRVCDCCGDMCGTPRVATFIGSAQVSDICQDCATAIANTVSPADGLPGPGPVHVLATPSHNTSILCADCGRTFGTPAALGSHARVHRVALTV